MTWRDNSASVPGQTVVPQGSSHRWAVSQDFVGSQRGAAAVRELVLRFTPSAEGLSLLIPDGSETRIFAQPTRSRGARWTDCPVHRARGSQRAQPLLPGAASPAAPSSTLLTDGRQASRKPAPSCVGAEPGPLLSRRCCHGGRPAAQSRSAGWRGHARPARALTLSLTQATVDEEGAGQHREAQHRPGGHQPPGSADHGSSVHV